MRIPAPLRTRSAGLFFAAAAVLSAGCAPKVTRVVRVVDTSAFPAHPWIGKAEPLVLEAWGRNPERQSDGENGSVLAYRSDSKVTVSVPREGFDSGAAGGGPWGGERPPSPFGTETRPNVSRVVARFWIDAEGKVYRVWFAPSVVKAGKDLPPDQTEQIPRSGLRVDSSFS